MSFAAVEDALQTWVRAASGLAGDHVIWSGQDVTRPSDPYVLLTLGDQQTEGAFDMLVIDEDLNRPAGTEIEQRVEGWRAFLLKVEAFTHDTTGVNCAFDMLTRIQTWLGLPGMRAALGAVDLGPSFNRGVIHNLPVKLGTSRFEAHAVTEIEFSRKVTASEFIGYINETRVAGTLAGSVSLQTGAVDIEIVGG